MKHEFRLIKEAEKELNEILKYYIDNAGIYVSNRFQYSFDDVVELIQTFPDIGRNLEEIKDVQYLIIPKFPYRIYYTVNKNKLSVIGLSIYHTKRDEEKIIPVLEKRKK